MALSVIGAGFGRTGTDSMRMALETLGLGPCHHMSEVLDHPEQLTMWRAVARGEASDWDTIFTGYQAAVDWPSAYYWRELADYYPDAKVLLTLRSTESWYQSMTKTIIPVIHASKDPDSLGIRVISQGEFGGRLDDRDHVMAVFERHAAEVQAAFPAERLLTYQLGDGWAPLCRFLDKPVPETPFPRSNSAAEFQTAMAERGEKGEP